MRLLAIGDIHGHAEALRTLLRAVNPTRLDKLVFLGDYVNKGPDVRGAIDQLLDLRKSVDAVFLRGNHDQLLLEAILDPEAVLAWEAMAGSDPLASYGSGRGRGAPLEVPENHVEFLREECRDYYETEEFIFVHGGISPHRSPHEEDRERLLWSTLSLAAPHLSGRTVVCGHSAQASGEIADLGHTICIDTGISKGKNLTCLNLDDFSYLQVSTKGEIRRDRLRPGPA